MQETEVSINKKTFNVSKILCKKYKVLIRILTQSKL